MSSFDVIVIGKGLMGAAAARHLALAGQRVALVGPDEPADKARHEGVFASHYDEGRITRSLAPDPDWSLLSRRSIERYREIERMAGMAFFVDCGALMAGPERWLDVPFIHDAAEVAERTGIVHDNLRDTTLAERFPYLRFPRGTLVLHERRGAGYLNPRALVKAQAIIARNLGATIVSEEVISLRETRSKVVATCMSGRVLSGKRAIVAAGAFSSRTDLLPSPLPLRVFARTVTFIQVDEAEATRLANMPTLVMAMQEGGSIPYLLPPIRYPDGRLYLKIGGDPSDIPLETLYDIKAWFRTSGNPCVHAYLTDLVKDLMPDLRAASISSGACVTAFTPSRKPIVAHQSDRIIALTGGNGAGAKCSDELGRLGARLAMGECLADEPYDTDFSGLA